MGVVKGQGHTVGPVSYLFASFSFYINQANNSRDTAISKFDPETPRDNVMSGVKGEGHHILPSIQPMHFHLLHINQTHNSWDMAWIIFVLEKHIRNVLRKFAKITFFL